MQRVLALETSCDESAVAVVQLQEGEIEVLANFIASQATEHARWGGVVPEISSRRHLEALPDLIAKALNDVRLPLSAFDAVAATVAPGLAGALMVGSVTARTLASLHSLPFLGIHHLEGHIASVSLGDKPPEPPYMVLLVSGGHTELIEMKVDGSLERHGRSHDDAAGEAFDKVARLLGLSYPGGPAIESASYGGDSERFVLPKGRISLPGGGFHPYDFSFSGLKTAMLRKVQELETKSGHLPISDLAASFQKVVAEVLVERSIRCTLDQGLKTLVMVGGVAANSKLRELMQERAGIEGIEISLAPKAFCTDNAAMVGAAALKRLELVYCTSSLELGVAPRWPLEQANDFYKQKPPF
ncbi:tRNA (adenosine(37)-N6)-threonylcarbamoyltransferase complex transferase subunit TsaD [Prochlorococcus sp. MIT 1300]|uniref:tRNA (adenosine(37)-N6)-threonylcarbamoyltransferase complex transferase subunit TsaD n=1 Tax=Prochlorococcus sp. MIT 1300 TaxID=3096218 RepID=UPI002A7663FF|nr:tRNA (adenosine(37)-N6)-threonylcarbamoyltransferase complex transferase subunit TsaD [Prochlorococcus sp. MIT 1300]